MSDTVEYFEDIDIGDEIAELDLRPTTADVVRFVDVARMQSELWMGKALITS